MDSGFNLTEGLRREAEPHLCAEKELSRWA